MKRLLCVFILAPLSFSCVAKDDPTKAMDGSWSATAAEIAGAKFPDEARKNVKLVVGDGKYSVTIGPESDKGTVTLDPTKSPKTVDITSTDGTNKGHTILAIYETSGNTMRICYDLSGKARPTDFKTEKGSQLFLVTYERDK